MVERTKSTVTINVSDSSKLATQKTFFVIGAGRGGTTSIAGSLSKLGINMGKTKYLHEDTRFRYGVNIGIPEMILKAQFVTYVNMRNLENKDVWGMKFLNPSFGLDGALEKAVDIDLFSSSTVRGPHLILVVRDVLAGFLGEAKAGINGLFSEEALEDPKKSLGHYFDIYRNYYKFFDALISRGYPLMVVSYEKMLLNKEDYADSLINFVNCDRLKSKRQDVIDFINPEPEYYWKNHKFE
jgi:hypothetical protein